jgi:hypothetical protein
VPSSRVNAQESILNLIILNLIILNLIILNLIILNLIILIHENEAARPH